MDPKGVAPLLRPLACVLPGSPSALSPIFAVGVDEGKLSLSPSLEVPLAYIGLESSLER